MKIKVICLMLVVCFGAVIMAESGAVGDSANRKIEISPPPVKELENKAESQKTLRWIIGPINVALGVVALVAAKNNLDQSQNSGAGFVMIFPTILVIGFGGLNLFTGIATLFTPDIYEKARTKMLTLNMTERDSFSRYCLSHNGSDEGYKPSDIK